MKKALLALLFSAATLGAASAQVEIGLKVSPSVTSLRAASSNGDALKDEGTRLGLGGGLIIDYFFGQNYAFSTGLEFVAKGGRVSYFDNIGVSGIGQRYEQRIGLQYLQVPLTIKLFTNDVAPDTKVYFQVGGAVGAVIGARIDGEKFFALPPGSSTKATKNFITPDVGLRLGTGIERQLGQSTRMIAGISYHRGLLNIDKFFETRPGIDNAELKNSEFALDFGIKF